MGDDFDGNETFRGQYAWVCDAEGKNCRNVPLSGILLPDGTAASNTKIKDKVLKDSPFIQTGLDENHKKSFGTPQTFLFVKNKGVADITVTLDCGDAEDIVIPLEANEIFAEDTIPFIALTFPEGATFKAYTKV
jgi:hypothetical protein